jgi:hypothetical protein
MANNVVEIQTIRDDDQYVTVKVTGVAANGWNVNAGSTLIQANQLFGSNASQAFCPLSLTDVKFSMDVGALGYIQFHWVSTVNVNTTIMTFGQIGSATFDGLSIYNNANTPSGDVGVVVSNLGAGNSFNFVLTFVKDKQPILAKDPLANVTYLGNPAGWANTDSWY